ncbi:hypothetical protein C8P68_1155 [Mucilaginibacter yixingensis]|uniref:Uncharacterized protein n=1 Tax=Mucilaginibacter yixingensis TaxID=1295612 RepID=A0A2T5J4C3_9SPHI|nr:hypothetical protein [Mucilaginibacter yixingensis]PTQ92009.1 hypothetical protein C8P68_1155 [Mucilaginibacter yixingensis]
MRIYIDQSTIQALKREGGDELLQRILEDNQKNIYCFSEAHIHDLVRDRTDEKFKDMDLLEQIAGNHCFHWDERPKFDPWTPRQHHARFDWDFQLDILEKSPEMSLLTDYLQTIPLNFRDLADESRLPADMPPDYRELFAQTTTFYDFFQAFYGFSHGLSAEQKKFRAFLQYLHKHDYLKVIYTHFGIEGFDGKQITDPKLFLETYSAYIKKQLTQKDDYSLFLAMYYSLEFLGLVKGKVRKQQLMNLINDARHAFFGAFCDIIVSSDEDFLKKTAFIYKAMQVWATPMTTDEFAAWLAKQAPPEHHFQGLLNELNDLHQKKLLRHEQVGTTTYTCYALERVYFYYFDTVTIGMEGETAFFYYSREQVRLSNGVFFEELNRIIEFLTKEIGPDLYDQGKAAPEEVTEGHWPGRAWLLDGYAAELVLNDHGIHLTFNPVPQTNEESTVSNRDA